MGNSTTNKDNHLHAILFAVLLVFSVLYFTYSFHSSTYFPSPYGRKDQDIIGMLFLFWAGLTTFRMLWMLEINIFFQAFRDLYKSEKTLPQRLLQDLSYRHMVQNSARSWKSLNMLSVTWLALGGIFMIWGSIIALHPLGHDAFTQMQIEIQSFLQTQAGKGSVIELSDISSFLLPVVKALIIGIVFWLGQNLAYGYKNSTAILWVCIVTFCLSFLSYITSDLMISDLFYNVGGYSHNLWHGYGWINVPIMNMMEIIPQSTLSPMQHRIITTGIPSIAILYSLGVFSFFSVMRGIALLPENKKYALAGGGILLLMGFCDIFLVQQDGLYGVWLSGWACISILWVKSGSRAEKRYRMFLK